VPTPEPTSTPMIYHRAVIPTKEVKDNTPQMGGISSVTIVPTAAPTSVPTTAPEVTSGEN